MKTAEDWTKPDGICDCIPTVEFIRAIQLDTLESAIAVVHVGDESVYDIDVCDAIVAKIRALIPQAAPVKP